MNVYYTKKAYWEYDFLKNDIFNKNLYDIKIKFILFDDNTEINKNNKYNIICSNRRISLKFLENMIKKLRPSIIFHLSDEGGKDIKYYNLYSRYNIKILFHQYNFEKLDYKINNFQIPLGYVSGFLLNKSYFDYKHKQTKYNKKYDFSFIGSMKSDRRNMLNKFNNNFRNNFIRTGPTDWSNPEKQNIKPHELFNIYKDSLFVPIGRGYKSLDCFRIYEAIVAGAIPVVCGPIEEIDVTFYFNNQSPYIITADTWDKAVLLCNELYSDKNKIYNIINSNHKWFQEKIIIISNIINELL